MSKKRARLQNVTLEEIDEWSMEELKNLERRPVSSEPKKSASDAALEVFRVEYKKNLAESGKKSGG